MKRWMRVVGMLAMMICGAGVARAQVHKVLVLGDDDAAPVAEGLKAKIKASGRVCGDGKAGGGGTDRGVDLLQDQSGSGLRAVDYLFSGEGESADESSGNVFD